MKKHVGKNLPDGFGELNYDVYFKDIQLVISLKMMLMNMKKSLKRVLKNTQRTIL